jgi:chromosomal replication initiator protein
MTNMDQVCWERARARLKAELGQDLYASWFARMEMEAREKGRLLLSVPTRFLKTWIETHYIDTLRKVCAEAFEDVSDVRLRIRSAERLQAPAVSAAATKASGGGRTQSQAQARPMAPDVEAGLDPDLTFDTFVVGMSNALAHAAARQVAEGAHGVRVNPLFIHAATGLGKTHLLHAIGWQARQARPGCRALYISAEQFMYRFLAALKNRDVLTFKEQFQTVDLLLIDDFQFLQGKTMQQEFCHTFNTLVDSRRQVVIAADVAPGMLDKLDARMRSRLVGGLVVDMQMPDEAMRREILKRKLELLRRRDPHLMVREEVLAFIAQTVNGAGRELEGALNRVIAMQRLMGDTPIDLDTAAHAMRDLIRRQESRPVRIEDILKAISQLYNVPKTELLSARRAQSVVRPRQIGMYLAKKLTARSLPEIGRRFGGRDHSTVLHAVRKIEKLLEQDENLKQEVTLLTRILKDGQ